MNAVNKACNHLFRQHSGRYNCVVCFKCDEFREYSSPLEANKAVALSQRKNKPRIPLGKKQCRKC